MNRLAQEASPYLQQHAGNPVDWWPWCEDALAKARAEDKPILLSIGYSACHWCHVMAHESFEDTETAAQMNRLFVNIKVDREERPDLDQIYQIAHQMLAELGGGWPLTVFLTPDGVPFFSGTYFPPQSRQGLPAFSDVLDWASDVYARQREAITTQNRTLLAALQSTVPVNAAKHALDLSLPQKAGAALLAQFDARHGGFGRAPKFPRCPDLALLLHLAVVDGDATARQAWLQALRGMAEGGIFDHLDGGFARYSIDAQWEIPHFEKMLYDNGLLLAHYAEAHALSGEALFEQVAGKTADWVLRAMQVKMGGDDGKVECAFCAALDADSEGEEGKYYVWDRRQVADLLSPEHYRVFAAYYGLNRSPNFEGTHWHLHVVEPLDMVAQACGIDTEIARLMLAEARALLLTERQKRIAPERDNKILTGWNALMITGLARAAAVFGERSWLDAAQQAMDFVRNRLWRDGRLWATCKAGKGGNAGQVEEIRLNAYLDDHAYLLEAALALMQAEFRRVDLDFACTLADTLLEHFEDPDAGGFFFTRDDHEQLILRSKPGQDNATPAGNAVAARALQRLGHLLGEMRYLDAAERALRVFHDDMRQAGKQSYWGYSSLTLALAEHAKPPGIVILFGPAAKTKKWQRRLQERCLPSTLVFYLPAEALPGLPLAMRKTEVVDRDVPQAWICHGTQCLPPLDDLEAVLASCWVAK